MVFFQPFNHGGFGFFHPQAVQKAGIDEFSVAGEGFFFYPLFALNYFNNIQAEFFGEGVVAFVVGGHGHNGACAITH